MPDFAVVTAFKATDRLSPAFKRMGNEADKFGRRASTSIGMVSKSMSMIRGVLPVFGVAALGMYINKAVDLASSLTEVQNVVDTTFGPEGARQINAWSKSAIKNFGLSELQAKQFTGFLGAMMKSSGLAGKDIVRMSQDMAGLAGDFASFYDLPIEEAFDKIRAGISGETEPLKRIGINMSVANMQAFALSRGIRKSWQSMNQAEQTMLRYNYLMTVSKDAQGDFNKTLEDSYANQKRVLGVMFDQALANMMKKILPMLTRAFKALNQAINKIDFEKLGEGLAAIAKIIPWLVYGFLAWKTATYAVAAAQVAMNLAGWIKYLWMMREFITKATVAQWLWNIALTANPIGLIIVGVAALIAIGVLLYKNWDLVKEKFLSAVSWMWDGIKMIGRGFMTCMMFPINLILTGVSKLFQLASKLPGVGGKFASAAQAVSDFQAKANSTLGSTNLLAPNGAREAGRSGVDFQGQLNIAGAPPGSTVTSKTRGAPPINMNLVGAQ